MPRRAAILSQADIARAVRAAIQAGATSVEVKPDGTVTIQLGGGGGDEAQWSEPPRKKIIL